MSEYPETISVAKNTHGSLYVPATALGGVNYVRADIAEAENARLKAELDNAERKSDLSADASFLNGMKFGHKLAVLGEEDEYHRQIEKRWKEICRVRSETKAMQAERGMG